MTYILKKYTFIRDAVKNVWFLESQYNVQPVCQKKSVFKFNTAIWWLLERNNKNQKITRVSKAYCKQTA